MTLRQLLHSPHDRAHVRKRQFEAYVRKVPRYLAGAVHPTITVADFQMRDLSEDGLQAAFEDWFRDLEKLASYHAMSIAFENAGGWDWMEKFLATHHFVRSEDPSVSPSQLDAYRLYRESL